MVRRTIGKTLGVLVVSGLIAAFTVTGLVAAPWAGADDEKKGCREDPCPVKGGGGKGVIKGTALHTTRGKTVAGRTGTGGSGGAVGWFETTLGCGEEDPTKIRGGCDQRASWCRRTGQKGITYNVTYFYNENRWESRGQICVDEPGEKLVGSEDVGEQIQDPWKALVPEQDPSMQPKGRKGVVHLRTLFHSGQPRVMPKESVEVFDFNILVSGTGKWTWTFAPGVTRTYTEPGSKYPDKKVGHTYEQAGPKKVHLHSTWRGFYYMPDGQGPFEFEQPAWQDTDFEFDIVESAPVLGGS